MVRRFSCRWTISGFRSVLDHSITFSPMSDDVFVSTDRVTSSPTSALTLRASPRQRDDPRKRKRRWGWGTQPKYLSLTLLHLAGRWSATGHSPLILVVTYGHCMTSKKSIGNYGIFYLQKSRSTGERGLPWEVLKRLLWLIIHYYYLFTWNRTINVIKTCTSLPKLTIIHDWQSCTVLLFYK